jgi:hypothetical protein
VGAATPGIHLRWLRWARVEFPYRERTMGVEFGTGGWRNSPVYTFPAFSIHRRDRSRRGPRDSFFPVRLSVATGLARIPIGMDQSSGRVVERLH